MSHRVEEDFHPQFRLESILRRLPKSCQEFLAALTQSPWSADRVLRRQAPIESEEPESERFSVSMDLIDLTMRLAEKEAVQMGQKVVTVDRFHLLPLSMQTTFSAVLLLCRESIPLACLKCFLSSVNTSHADGWIDANFGYLHDYVESGEINANAQLSATVRSSCAAIGRTLLADGSSVFSRNKFQRKQTLIDVSEPMQEDIAIDVKPASPSPSPPSPVISNSQMKVVLDKILQSTGQSLYSSQNLGGKLCQLFKSFLFGEMFLPIAELRDCLTGCSKEQIDQLATAICFDELSESQFCALCSLISEIDFETDSFLMTHLFSKTITSWVSSSACTASRSVKAGLLTVLQAQSLPFTRSVLVPLLIDRALLDSLRVDLFCAIYRESPDSSSRETALNGLLQSKVFFHEIWSDEQIMVLLCLLGSKFIVGNDVAAAMSDALENNAVAHASNPKFTRLVLELIRYHGIDVRPFCEFESTLERVLQISNNVLKKAALAALKKMR